MLQLKHRIKPPHRAFSKKCHCSPVTQSSTNNPKHTQHVILFRAGPFSVLDFYEVTGLTFRWFWCLCLKAVWILSPAGRRTSYMFCLENQNFCHQTEESCRLKNSFIPQSVNMLSQSLVLHWWCAGFLLDWIWLWCGILHLTVVCVCFSGMSRPQGVQMFWVTDVVLLTGPTYSQTIFSRATDELTTTISPLYVYKARSRNGEQDPAGVPDQCHRAGAAIRAAFECVHFGFGWTNTCSNDDLHIRLSSLLLISQC